MRATVLALVLVSACRVADVHFLGAGGDDAPPPTDAPQMFDAPFAVASHAYLADSTTGIFLLAMSANGEPAFTGVVYPGPTSSAVINPTTKRIYAVLQASPPVVRTYVIQPDGTLVAQPDQALPCTGGEIAISPTSGGNILVVGCVNSPMVVSFAVDAQGLPGTQHVQQVGNSISPAIPMFVPNKSCMYVADVQPPAGGQSVHLYQWDATGALTPLTSGGLGIQSIRALATNPQGNMLYIATPQTLLSYSVSNQCNLGAASMTGTDPTPQAIAVDPLGKNLVVAGSAAYTYSISAGNAQANFGNPYLGTTQLLTGATLDAMGTNLYVTSAGFSGVLHAQVAANGSVTPSPSPASSPSAGSPHMLLLGP